jgi:hypothetical protein
MHRHILIPTDGSELSQNAIDYGMALAKSVNAKVTVLTVSTPFHTFAVEPGMITDTPEQYGKRMATLCCKISQRGDGGRTGSRCELRDDARRTRSAISGHHRDGGTKIVRSDCHGFAWPAWDFRDRARERNRKGADTQHHPGSRLSRAAPGILPGAGVVDLTDILDQRARERL